VTPAPTSRAPGVAPNAAATTRLEELRAEVRERPSGAAFYGIAHYAAKLGSTEEALDALRRLDAMGWDGGVADEAFPELTRLPAFRTLAASLAAREPVAHESVPGFTIPEPGLHAEGIAYDPERATFYVSSTTSGRIVARDANGNVRDVVNTGLREVLGLKVGGPERLLWAACTDDEHADGDTCVLAIDPANGRIARRACIPAQGQAHELNDLAISSSGVVYVTDAGSGAVLRLPVGSTQLETLVPAGRLRGSNGIVLGAGDGVLLVAHSRGIARIELSSGSLSAVEAPPSATFVGIDGMSLRDDRTLFAIANTYGRPRVSRITLDAPLARAEHFEVLETENPEWDEPTTGALGPDGLYYVADSQMNSGAAARPTVVLKLRF
jgi:sugar lactone lactonase YvrE